MLRPIIKSRHSMNYAGELIFENYGGSYQLKIKKADDLKKIQVLDDVYWAAVSAPINSFNCDHAFVSYVDTDQNGRIRTNEIREAQLWLFRFLANRSHLSEGTDILNLNDIDTSHPEGQRLQAAAKLILANLNLTGAREISLSQVRDVQNIMAKAVNNGDGVIPPEAVSDPDLSGFITSVIDTVGSVLDISGKKGIDQNRLEMFLNEAENYLAWVEEGKIPQGQNTTEIMPWGADSSQAYELIAGMDDKIEQYFAQCAMVRLDERSQAQMKFSQKELEEIDFTDKSVMESRISDAPLAVPNPEGVIELESGVNSLYAGRLFELKEKVLKRVLGEPVKQLTQKQWDKVKDIFTPHKIWLKKKRGAAVEKLGEEKLRSYLNGRYKERVSSLIAKDLAVADDLKQIRNLEKLILYQKYLMELANNFVSFSNLYNPRTRSLFERGTLIIDGRKIAFAMEIQDRQKHIKAAEKSYMYLLYAEVTGRQDKDIKFDIVAAVTSGSAGNLRIGKRGIFLTTDGCLWDAQIVDIVENPISIWESVRAPFQQLTVFVKKQVGKFNKSHQDKLEKSLAAPSASGVTRDLLLGGSVAVAALGSSFAYITKALSQVKAIHILAVLAGIAAIILFPGIIIGFIKIRKRDMSVLLEASGWAVNTRMRLNDTLGRLFTYVPRLPKNARREHKDIAAQFIKKFSSVSVYSRKMPVTILIVLAIMLGIILVLFTLPQLKFLY